MNKIDKYLNEGNSSYHKIAGMISKFHTTAEKLEIKLYKEISKALQKAEDVDELYKIRSAVEEVSMPGTYVDWSGVESMITSKIQKY